MNAAVYGIFNEGIASISASEIEVQKSISSQLETKRARICFHRDSSDLIHEMIITFYKDTYVRPHKHVSKTESYLVIDGEIEIIFFDDLGNINKRVPMGNYASDKIFYLKSISNEWHTVIIKTDFATILEVTNGPFIANDCLFASWSPEITDIKGAKEYIKALL